MFQHILFPTDGEAPSVAVMAHCMSFAKQCGARVTALHVIEPFQIVSTDTAMLRDTRDSYAVHSQAKARRVLEGVAELASQHAVACDTLCVEHEDPYVAIIDAARSHACDLIVMASHGRRGVRGMLMGSETQKVLTHTQLPVLVYR